MDDWLSWEPGVLVALFVAATVALVLLHYVRRLVAALVGGASLVVAVLLCIEWVGIADQIESAMHQIYHVGLLIAAILCVGLSMACLRWFASSAESDAAPSAPETEAAAVPTRPDPSPTEPDDQQQRVAEDAERERDFDDQRQRVRDQVAREKAARQDGA